MQPPASRARTEPGSARTSAAIASGSSPAPCARWSGAYPSASGPSEGRPPIFIFFSFPGDGDTRAPPPVGDASKNPLSPGPASPGFARSRTASASSASSSALTRIASATASIASAGALYLAAKCIGDAPSAFRTSDAPGNARATATVALASSPRRAA